MVDVVPVDVGKKGMAHDLLRIGGAGAQAQLGLAGQELLENRHRVPRHVDGIQRLVSEDSVVDLILVFTTEW